MIDKIGLFPLKLVIFPGFTIPLHIFEERYKLLVNKAFSEKSDFGINLNDSVKLHDVGCTVKVREITKAYSDGRMDIMVEGYRRYHLKRFTEGKEGYYIGEVEFFDDIKEKIDHTLLDSCIEQYNEIISKLSEFSVVKIDKKSLQNDMPSFGIAAKTGLTLIQRQELLAIRSENQRLEAIHFHLTKVMPLANREDQANSIIKNDGYFRYK